MTDSVGGGVEVTRTPDECREHSLRPLLPIDVCVNLLVDVVGLLLLQDVVVILVDLLVDVVGMLLLQDVVVALVDLLVDVVGVLLLQDVVDN